MKNYKFVNNITGWVIFIIASVVYLLTIEPTASFWDCGEFISSAHNLIVGHPPGAPFFMIMGKFFSLFASDNENIARMVNSMSALASSATIMLLFWSITHLARKFVVKNGEPSVVQTMMITGAGLVGALAYTFSDTFWFSAVEGEVYASSSLFTALVFWAILKWENIADERHSNRWLILIAYFIGISIGVHLLNLLAIPAIVLVFYFRKFKPTRNGVIIAIGISFVALLFIMYGIIPGIVKVAGQFELLFVNRFGFGFNSGTLFYSFTVIALLVGGIYSTLYKPNFKNNWVLVTLAIALLGIPFITGSVLFNIIILGGITGIIYYFRQNRELLNTILTVTTVIVIGYSSYAIIVIRSNANPPMDQNNPETPFGLRYYLGREQYGDNPLFYGHYYSAPYRGSQNTTPFYSKVGDRYEFTSHKIKYEFDDNFKTIFPRMYSREAHHIMAYKQWGKIKGTRVRTTDERGSPTTIERPTFSENLRFFMRYQVNFMYWRYFLWNFAGRQNDIQGHGYNEDNSRDLLRGNWISGIKFIDEARLGPQDNLPDSIKNNKARNKYYMLPLLLGLLGMVYHYRKHKKDFWVVMALFFMTGLAILLYLNQNPYQPRERDYAYAGSFYVFTIWIGFGVIAIIEWLAKVISQKYSTVPVTLACLVLVPGIMAKENWDDHDRSGSYTARDIAFNYLQSCKPNAIIFTNGDNDTFPLWYIQEVEGVRTDVRVCNLSYLSADWYIEQMQRKAYLSDPLPFTLDKYQYRQGTRDIVYVTEQTTRPVDLKMAMRMVASERPETKLMLGTEQFSYIPSRNISLSVNKDAIISNGLLDPKYHDMMLDEITWSLKGNYLNKSQLMVLDLLAGNNWERPVYFAITVPRDNYMNLQDYFQMTGMAYQLVPLKNAAEDGIVTNIDTDQMYENLVNNFRWGGIENEKVYLNENNLRMFTNFRNNFTMLADALIKEGDRERALITLDRSLEVIPERSVPYDYILTPYISLYYELEQHDKAFEIFEKVMDRLTEEMDYYFTFRGPKRQSVSREIETNLRFLYQLTQIAQVYQPDVAERVEEKFNAYYKRLQPF